MRTIPQTLTTVLALLIAVFAIFFAYGAREDLTKLQAQTDALVEQNKALEEGLARFNASESNNSGDEDASGNAQLASLEDFTLVLNDRILDLESQRISEPLTANVSSTNVRAALMDDPGMIFDAVEEFERLQVIEQANLYQDELYQDQYVPVLGNPEGDITLVEYFDYNCGYCRRVVEDVMQLVEDDGNIRLILKEYPILSEDSQRAALIALAAAEDVDYLQLHRMAMTWGGNVDDQVMLQNAALLGGDPEVIQARATENQDEYLQALQRNRQVAQALGFTGTPAFFIEGETIPGAVSKEQIEDIIQSIRDRRDSES